MIKRDSEWVFLALLFMTFYTAPIFSYCPLRFSDIGGLIFIILSLRRKKTIPKRDVSLSAMLLGLWCLVDILFLFSLPSFDVTNHITQSVRLLGAILMFICLPNFLENYGGEKLAVILRKVLVFHLWIQVIYVVLYYGGVGIFNVIHVDEERAALISENYLFFNHFIIVNIASGYPRFSGLFEEPAWFGWTINLAVAYILQFQYTFHKNILLQKDWALIAVAFFFTYSISSLICLLIITGVYLSKKYSQQIFKIIGVSILCVLFVVIYIKINPFFLDRIQLIGEGGDGSTSFRIIGSVNGFLSTLSNNPLIGYGLGDTNTVQYFQSLHSLGLAHGLAINGEYILDMHNILFQVICNLGILGGLFFFYPFLKLFSLKNIVITTGFILVFFCVNVYNTFYLFFIISASVYFYTASYKERRIA